MSGLLFIITLVAIYVLTVLTNIVLFFFICLLHSKIEDYDKDKFKEYWEKEYNVTAQETPFIFVPPINFVGTVIFLVVFIYSFFMFLFIRILKVLSKNVGQQKTIAELLSDLFF